MAKNKYVEEEKKISIHWLVILALFIYWFFSTVIVPLNIKSITMNPTIKKGDHVIYSSLPLHINDFQGKKIKYGDIVVVHPPYVPQISGVRSFFGHLLRFFTFNLVNLNSKHTIEQTSNFMLLRVIGLPGDTIKMENFNALVKLKGSDYYSTEFEVTHKKYQITINNKSIYWSKDFPKTGNLEPITLEKKEYFLLADNRVNSNDSRDWGALNQSYILGKVLFRYWPFKSFGTP